MVGVFLMILGGLTALVMALIALYMFIDFVCRFVLSIIMIRQWRREEKA